MRTWLPAAAFLATVTACSAGTPGPQPAPTTVPGVRPELAAVPDLPSAGLTTAWEKLSGTTAKTGRQLIVGFPDPSGNGDVMLTWVPMPGDPESVVGVACLHRGRATPHDREAVSRLFDRCLPPGVADDRREEIAAWLKTVSVGDSRAVHRFDGYNVLVVHDPAGHLNPGPDPDPDQDGSALRIYLSGGTEVPG